MQPGSPGWERLQGPNQWPTALPGLRDVVERWDAELSGVARRLLHAWARALGQPETVFDSAFGELLEFATGGYLRATKHRVVSPPEGTERISAPFFFNPALDSQIPILTLPAELAAEAAGVTADPLNPIFGSYGENAMKSRLRAHPDVAAIHHGDLVDRTA